MPLPSLVEDALAEAKNEPVNWLLGQSLRQYCEIPAGHFLLNSLAAPRTGTLAGWNAWIYRFHDLLVNPDQASTKAYADLRAMVRILIWTLSFVVWLPRSKRS